MQALFVTYDPQCRHVTAVYGSDADLQGLEAIAQQMAHLPHVHAEAIRVRVSTAPHEVVPAVRINVRGGDALQALTLFKELTNPVLPYTMTVFEVVIRQCPRGRITAVAEKPVFLPGLQPAPEEREAFTCDLARRLFDIRLDLLISAQVFAEVKEIMRGFGVHVVDLVLSRGKKSCTCPLS